MTVGAQCIVECFQPLNDRLAIGIRQMSHAAAVAQFALRNIGKLLGQGVEPADQLPYLIGRGRNINARAPATFAPWSTGKGACAATSLC